MSATDELPGVLMPWPSLLVLGESPQGAAALSLFGIVLDREPGSTTSVVETLAGAAGDDDLRVCLTLARDVAASADRWFHVVVGDPELPPTVVLSGGGSAVACSLHGEVVEWLSADEELLQEIALRAVHVARGRAVVVTAFDRDTCLGSVRVHDGTMDVAARDDTALARLSAARDVGGAVAELRGLADGRAVTA